jgi:PAS domain S-box-containing protein
MKLMKLLKPYLVTLLILAAVVALKAFVPSLNSLVLSVTFFIAIILVARYLGLWPGVFFMISALGIYLAFFAPKNLNLKDPQVLLRLFIFLLEFFVIIYVTHWFSKYRQQLSSSELKFKLLIETSPTVFILFNEKKEKIYVSPSIKEVLGYTPEAFLKLPYMGVLQEDERESMLPDIEKVFDTDNRTIQHTHHIKHKDGHYIIGKTTITNLLSTKGVKAVVVNIQDLTKEKTAEENAAQKTKMLEILNNVSLSVSEELDLQAILQKVTDATTNLSGAQFGAFFYNQVNAEGNSYMLYTLSGARRDQFDGFGMPRATAVFHPTFAGEAVVRVDDITKDPRYGKMGPHFGMPKGHLPVVSYMAVPVIAKSGEVIGGLFFGHSKPAVFTEEAEQLVTGVAAQAAAALDNARLFETVKTANSENKKLLILADELNQKKDEFISIASHELKTPLTSIKAYVQLLDREFGAASSNGTSQYFKKTLTYVNRLQSLIEDLLNVSKIQAGKLDYSMTDFPMEELIEETVSTFNNTVSSHKLVVHVKTTSVIHGDKQRLEQVLTNLLSNAVKYAPGTNEIILSVSKQDHELIFCVADHGIGIAPDQLEKIFERYNRIENDYRFSGLGIGLYIASEIVQRHHGRIWVESELGNGSEFYFTLPTATS